MDYRKNAPWTAVSRERLARMVVNEGFSLKAAAARFSVSAKAPAHFVSRPLGLSHNSVRFAVLQNAAFS